MDWSTFGLGVFIGGFAGCVLGIAVMAILAAAGDDGYDL